MNTPNERWSIHSIHSNLTTWVSNSTVHCTVYSIHEYSFVTDIWEPPVIEISLKLKLRFQCMFFSYFQLGIIETAVCWSFISLDGCFSTKNTVPNLVSNFWDSVRCDSNLLLSKEYDYLENILQYKSKYTYRIPLYL